jgi:hypothetical protein
MVRVEKTVFISYRRTDVPWALAIFLDLTSHGFDVFFDYDGIASGDFERVIIDNIRAKAHFLVLLTPSALERCTEPTDWLRREIEAALDNQRNLVPLMLGGFDFGAPSIASQLTGKLSALKHYNALSVPAAFFGEAMDRLRNKYLNVPLTAVLHPAAISAQLAAKEQKTATETALAVLKDTQFDVAESIRCEASIIRQFSRVNLPESHYVREAREHGWYPEGSVTSFKDVGNLLELHGIPVHRYTNANIFNLATELAQGHKVIIGMAADAPWAQNSILARIGYKFGFAGMSRVANIVEIDVGDPESVKVVIASDPGTGEVAARYPLDNFLDAYQQGPFFMVATQNSPLEV